LIELLQDTFHAVRLSYLDDKGYMMLVLPRKPLVLDDVKSEVIKRLGEVVRSEEWGVRLVELSLPRFSFESSHNMTQVRLYKLR